MIQGLGIGGYLHFDKPYIKEVYCYDDVDKALLNELHCAGADIDKFIIQSCHCIDKIKPFHNRAEYRDFKDFKKWSSVF
jgi:hypothetical protein